MNLMGIPIGIGTWFLGEDRRKCDSEIIAIRRGLDLGPQVVDAAKMYGSGASKELADEATAERRDDVSLVLKVLPSSALASGMCKALEASFYKLNTSRLDLYLYHWHGHHQLKETVEALRTVAGGGLTGVQGISNSDPADMDDPTGLGATPATNQVLYNLLRKGPEYGPLPFIRERGMDPMVYSLLEQGRLLQDQPGKLLSEIAVKAGTTLVTLALAWAVREPGSIAIPRTSSPEHMRENASALQVTLTPEILRDFDEVFTSPSGSRPLEVL